MRLDFSYGNDTNVDTITKWNGHEMEINGDFGSLRLNLLNPERYLYFKAQKITFKLQPEH